MKEITFLVFSQGGVEYVSVETLMGSYENYTRTAFETCLVIKQLERWCMSEHMAAFHTKLLAHLAQCIEKEAKKVTNLFRARQLRCILDLVYQNYEMPRAAFGAVHNRIVDLEQADSQPRVRPIHIDYNSDSDICTFHLFSVKYHCFK